MLFHNFVDDLQVSFGARLIFFLRSEVGHCEVFHVYSCWLILRCFHIVSFAEVRVGCPSLVVWFFVLDYVLTFHSLQVLGFFVFTQDWFRCLLALLAHLSFEFLRLLRDIDSLHHNVFLFGYSSLHFNYTFFKALLLVA